MPKQIGRSKVQFKDFLANVEGIDLEAGDDDFFKLFDEAQELEKLADDHRHNSLSTQLREDHHLMLYRQWIKRVMGNAMDQNLPEDEALDLLGFPDPDNTRQDPWEKLLKQLRYFLQFAVTRCVPRSTDDKFISYRVLLHYRRSLLFWVTKKYAKRKIEPPKAHIVRQSLTTMMRFLSSHYKIISGRASGTNSTRVGSWELLQIMDFDLQETQCIALAECHHLAWVLGRLGALRPGSLALPERVDKDRHLPYLVWGDLAIEQMREPGKFSVRMTIRNLKANVLDPERVMEHNKTLVLTLNSPRGTMTFELSAPHRILTIALRRGALADIETLDDLFNNKLKFIRIKKDFLDKPVLLAGGKRGLSVDPDKPMKSGALTEYLKLRGQKVGFVEGITFYSIRRNTAQDLLTKIGSEKTRAIMAHDPDSRVLETYYTQERTALIDVTALALNETSNDDDPRITENLAITRLRPEQLRKMGPMLNALVAELRETDEDYPHGVSTRETKNRDRVLRHSALKTLIKDLADESSRRLTVDEATARVELIESHSRTFNHRLLDQARRYIQQRNADDEAHSNPHVNLDEEFDEETDEHPEADAEDQFSGQINRNEGVQTFPDELRDVQDQLADIDYATAARSAMEIWLNFENEESIKQGLGKKQKVVPCHLCKDDDTIDDNKKAKLWPPSKLERHLKGEVHSRFGQFGRRVAKAAQDAGRQGVQCEICAQIIPENIIISLPEYATISELTRHIERSTIKSLQAIDRDCAWWKDLSEATQAKLAREHDEIKRASGWYDTNFKGDQAQKEKDKKDAKDRQRRRDSLINKALEFADDIRELPNMIPVPDKPGLFYGGPPMSERNDPPRPGIEYVELDELLARPPTAPSSRLIACEIPTMENFVFEPPTRRNAPHLTAGPSYRVQNISGQELLDAAMED